MNADAIARGLNGFNPESEAAKAGRVMLDHLRELAARRADFSFETTLAGRAYAGWLTELKATGYQVHLYYYWLNSPEPAIAGCGAGPGGRPPHPRADDPAAVRPERAELLRAVTLAGGHVGGV